MRRLMLTILVAAMLLAGVLAVAPAGAQAASAKAPVSAKRSSDPLVGNWYRGKMWFRVRGPNANGVYRAAWSNGHGGLMYYKIMRRSDGVYYETANYRNTYRLLNSYTVRVHYKTTGGRYISRNFARVG
jgi:hypothetical protein